MNWYLLLKFLHVSAAIAWLGGAGALVFAGTIVATYDARKSVIQTVTFLSKRLFIPALGVVLLTGAINWWVSGFTLDAWVAYGLAGIVVTGVIGATILGPTAERIAKMMDANAKPDELKPAMFRLLRGAQADMFALFSIVFAMVMKPTWADTGVLIGMIVVVAAGAAFCLTRPMPET